MAGHRDEPEGHSDPQSRPTATPDQDGARRDDDVSWLGCLWLVVVPLLVLGVVVVTLNWLGC